ncbi:MAG: S-adenosylmethionine hydrolase [Planctomycetota bacterium]|jgi:S-adenosylmethionine hydrolase
MSSTNSPLWKPCGIVTLLTDFGQTDAYVGIMRGVLATCCPGLSEVVDLTHAIQPQDIRGGAFQLKHAWSYFPPGTVHLAVVDPGVGSERRALLALDRGHAFVAPDNGLLAPVLSADAEVFELDVEGIALPNRSRTFHGRDVFAPAAAALAGGRSPAELGQRTDLAVDLQFNEPVALSGAGCWRGEVLQVDHYGNLVSNLPATLLNHARGAKPAQLSLCGHAVTVVGTYADVNEGELLALVDSFGLLEVAVRGGSAAGILGCGVGEQIEMELR